MNSHWLVWLRAILLVLVSSLFSISLVAQNVSRTSDAVELRVGQMFPTVIFPSLDGGRPASVADFRGKKLILHIFANGPY